MEEEEEEEEKAEDEAKVVARGIGEKRKSEHTPHAHTRGVDPSPSQRNGGETLTYVTRLVPYPTCTAHSTQQRKTAKLLG